MSDAGIDDAPLYSTTLAVRWGDMDAFNHVNNAEYLRYLEEARVQWLAAIPGMTLGGEIAPVLVASHVNYRRAIEWPGSVVVELRIEKAGTRSLTMNHRMLSADDERALHCDGYVVMVWIDTRTGQSVDLPEPVRALA